MASGPRKTVGFKVGGRPSSSRRASGKLPSGSAKPSTGPNTASLRGPASSGARVVAEASARRQSCST